MSALTNRFTQWLAAAALPAAVLAAPLFTPLAAQQPQVRTLGAPEATFDEPFSSVQPTSIRELSNGRVLVADARDKTVQLIDFINQSATSFGREGQGPGEYGLPLGLFPAPGDTTFLFDMMTQRVLVVTPDAKSGGEFRMEARRAETRANAAPSAPAGPQIIQILIPRAGDASGRLYATGGAVTMSPSGPVPADSVVLVRFDRAAGTLDTVGFLAQAKSNVNTSGSAQGGMQMRIGGANPLAPGDAWAVFPDGRVAIVRATDYHVDFYANGRKTSGAPIRYTPIRVTSADRAEEEARRQRARQNSATMMMTMGPQGTQRTAQMGPGPNAPPLEPLTDYPDVKPAFRANGSVLARPNGELWVARTEAAGAKGTLYDVINPAGAVIHQMRVPDGWTLVGFGNGTAYTTTTDDDGLVTLRRHKL